MKIWKFIFESISKIESKNLSIKDLTIISSQLATQIFEVF